MADFTQQSQGHRATKKRCHDEYSVDEINPHQGSAYLQSHAISAVSAFVSQVPGDNVDDFAASPWPPMWPGGNYHLPPLPPVHDHSWLPANSLGNSYSSYEHLVQQQAMPLFWQPTLPTQALPASTLPVPALPAVALPDAQMSASSLWHQGQLSIEQSNIQSGQPSPQDHTQVALAFETTNQHGSTCTVDPNVVCFGMINRLLGRCQLSSSSNMSSYQVQLTTADSFTGTEDVAFKGKVSHEFTYVTVALLAERDLVLETNCSISETPSGVGRIPGYSTPCSLGIIIYGPMELFDDIGSFFEEYNLYLQDPIDCKRNVRYCNPHRLSVDPSASKLTFDLCNKPAQSVTILEVDTHPEMLDVLYSQEDLAETAQPGSIKTTLEKHQRQALTFMLQRENGWAWDGGRADIWEVRDTGHEPYFYNTVSGVSQAEQPPQFYGGICADPMGLGKTLSMIALIACDLRVDDADPASLPGVDIEESSGKTLVILPPPLLISWEEQLQRHVFPNSLPWCRHHGKSRLRDSSELNDVLIVLTTYHTVMAEWRNAAGTDHSILLKTKWKRIVLDEAHFIRNTDSQMARAICSLDSVSRWAVTGTPIQNKLGDLAALLKFLKVHPYSEKRQFDSDVSNLWKSGHVEKAVERLKRLSACLLLRRPKETVQLPPRQDLQYSVEFTQAERQLYEDVRSQVISHIDEAILQRDKSASSDFFINVLQRIEAMRMVCDLGVYYHSRHETFTSCGQPEKGWPDEAQRAFNLRREMGPIQCEGCRSSLDTLDDVFSESGQTRISLFSRCLAFLCYTCSQRHTSDMGFCHHEPLCPVASISTDSFITEDPSPTLQGGLSHGHPSKVAMLLDDLRTLPADTKCVVFSTWRMTLNVVDAGLKQACMPALRFDGTIPQKDRQRVLDQFRNDASIRVLLLTLTCGAVGLTLTEASRAYLMEPHWNPTLEDQALARIHRIGQTRAVTTIRFFMRDSFEERIIQVQDSKRDLAGILLNPPNSEQGEAERGSGRLEYLRGLI